MASKHYWTYRRLFVVASVILVICLLLTAIQINIAVFQPNVRPIDSLDVRPSGHLTIGANDRWVVVTTAMVVSSLEVDRLTSLHGWSVLIIADDLDGPMGWRPPDHVTVMGRDGIRKWMHSRFPTNSQSRRDHDLINTTIHMENLDPSHGEWGRSCGLLFALSHGARSVYVTDVLDGRSIKEYVAKFYLRQKKSILMADRKDVFHVYGHFGQRFLYPRSLSPDVYKVDNLTHSYRLLYDWKLPAVQNVIGYCRGFFAVQRSTRRWSPAFDPTSPPVMLGQGTMAAYTNRNTFYAYNALWAVVTPTTTKPGVRGEWVGFWVQRLLWEIDENLAFFPPLTGRRGHPISSTQTELDDEDKDDGDQKEVTFQTRRFVGFLRSWSCDQRYSFFQCVNSLNIGLVKNGFWLQKDADVIKLWLGYFTKLHYIQPNRHQFSYPNKHPITDKTDLSLYYGLNSDQSVPVRFVSSLEFEISKDPTEKPYNISSHSDKLRKLCPKMNVTSGYTDINMSPASNSKLIDHFFDVLLLIIFNHPHYDVIKYLEAAYRPLFKHIVYCGENMESFLNETKSFPLLTFLEVDIRHGYFGPRCMEKVLHMGFDVKGYLQIGDDDLMFWWNLTKYDKSHVWRDDTHSYLDQNKGRKQESWWPTKFGKVPYSNVFTELNTTEPADPDIIPHKEFVNRFLKTVETGLVKGISDTFYIPQRLRNNVAYYLHLFFKHGLFLEFTCPIVLIGIEEDEKIVDMKILNLRRGQRKQLELFYLKHRELDGIHPFKLSTQTVRRPFCGDYVMELLTNMV